jgi:hypothetical protein
MYLYINLIPKPLPLKTTEKLQIRKSKGKMICTPKPFTHLAGNSNEDFSNVFVAGLASLGCHPKKKTPIPKKPETMPNRKSITKIIKSSNFLDILLNCCILD